MRRLLKYIIVLAAIAGGLVGTSYVGARARSGIFLGSPLPDLGPRTVSFNFDGVSEFSGNPKAWVFTYGPGQFPGVPQMRIYVAITGRLIGTMPRDLETRLRRYQTPNP